jgi:hypothetical protein
MACGARGIISEPFTDYKAIAQRYENCFIAGEGDNRVLTRNDPAEIRSMVASMAETGRMSGGYMMCIGNHIPFKCPARPSSATSICRKNWHADDRQGATEQGGYLA